MKLKIYNKTGDLRVSVEPDDNSTHQFQLMNDNVLNLSFTLAEYISLEVNDFIEFDNQRFTLLNNHEPEMESTQKYKYSPKFYGIESECKKALMLKMVDDELDPSFALDDSLEEHLKLVVDNINRIKDENLFLPGNFLADAPKKNIDYQQVSCYDALNLIAEAYETEWWIDGNRINITKCSRADYPTVPLAYRQGLKSLSKEDGQDVKFFTRLFPIGSTRNILYDHYRFNRLRLPEENGVRPKYVENNTEYGIYEMTEQDAFAHIYPRRIGTITSVTEYDKVVNGENIKAYRFKDDGLDFDPNDYAKFPDLKMSIVFESSVNLSGRDFEVTFDAINKEFEIQPKFPYENQHLPNQSLKPLPGDEYILYNISMPDEYYGYAEQELKEAVEEYIKKYSQDISVYKGDTDYIYLDENNIDLFPGRQVKLASDIYFNGERETRVTGFTRKINRKNDMNISFSNVVGKGRMENIEKNIEKLQAAITREKAQSFTLLKTFDSTEPSEYNVFTSKRSLHEIDTRSLSKQKDDVADGHITFENGILVKSNLTSLGARYNISPSLDELGNDDPTYLSDAMVEEGNGDPTYVSGAVLEQAGSGDGLIGGTLGALENVDDAFDMLPNGKYAFEMKDGYLYPVEAASFSSGSLIALNYFSDGVVTVPYGRETMIEYTFSSTIDGQETGQGTVSYQINNKKVGAGSISQGYNSFDVTSYLILGTNNIIVEVTDVYNKSRRLTFTVNAINIGISSTFSSTLPQTGNIAYRYTPIGSIDKTIHFLIDGKEIAKNVTDVSNRQLTQNLPAQSHGSHSLEVYVTATMSGVSIESDHLYYELICLEQNNFTPIITSSFNQVSAEQYTTLLIPYQVYNPANSVAEVTLVANNQEVSTLKVDRSLQMWSYRLNQQGKLTLQIISEGITKTFEMDIIESSIASNAETNDLDLFLTSMGRNNNEVDRDKWTYKGEKGNITARMNGFNWGTNGWILDHNGNVVLRISGDARVEIPVQPFGDDIRLKGKTIEIEFATSNVRDYDAVIASCWDNNKGFRITAQQALFRGTQTYVETQFKEDERIRISFVVDEIFEKRLIYTYINGIISGTKQYAMDDSFTQNNPVGISLGSDQCTLDIYNIRIYDNNLNQHQILDNYIADMDDINKKIELYEKNRVYDDYGDLDYYKVVQKIPVMTVIGELPQYKGDKKTVQITYENMLQPDKSFTANGCQIDVQGTSSQYYPRKNYKTNFKEGFTLASGEYTDKYRLNADSVAANIFCEKADFAESSGTHNTGMANLMDETLKSLGIYTPPQIADGKIRTTIEGFPIVIFHKDAESSIPVFVGKYNFNTDKAAEETFGFTDYPACECWEFCNNTSDRMLFKDSDYTRKDLGGNMDWLNDFEARYPDDDSLNDEYENGKVPVNLKRVTDWIVSCKDNPDKFKRECAQYLDIPTLVAYYALTELFGMVDQRAKNMFLTTWDGRIWYFIFYDNDTCLGINNEGAISFNYDIEYHDTIGSQNVWNGSDSTLWKNVETVFADDIKELYRRIRQENILSYEEVYNRLNVEQSDKWCEAIYNADGMFKYILPLDEGKNYLYALQGSRAEHRKWWIYNRFRYMDSKYNVGDYFQDYATMRLYTPRDWTNVEPNGNFNLVAYADQYLCVKYGSYTTPAIRAPRGVETIIQAPEGQVFNDTETIIYGASRLKSVGDLSAKYAGTIDMSHAVKLEELIIGSDARGYVNTNLISVTVKNNKLLRKVNVMNCPNLKDEPLDLSGCDNIEEIYAEGSGLPGVVLPAGGNLRIMHLPETITSLKITNQTELTDDGLQIAGLRNLTMLTIENTDINAMAIINAADKLERVRLININWESPNLDLLERLALMGGIDANGTNVSKAVVTGRYFARTVTSYKLNKIEEIFPELTITYGRLIKDTETTFLFYSSKSGKGINNAIFESNYTYEKLNENSYKVIADDDNIINVNFKCDEHSDFLKEYLVQGTRTQSYTVNYLPLRTIKIQTIDYQPIVGAIMDIDNDRYVTDGNGCIFIRANTLEGTITHPGYSKQNIILALAIDDTVDNFILYPDIEVKFVVKDDVGTCIEGAMVKVKEESLRTNIYGECIFGLVKGDYEYNVTSPKGDYNLTGRFTVDKKNIIVETPALPFDYLQYIPEENGNLKLMVATSLIDKTVSFYVNAPKSEYIIDWGDGTQTSATGIGVQIYDHNYPDFNSSYQVELLNGKEVSIFEEYSSRSKTVAFWSIGNTNAVTTCLYMNNLKYIGLIFKNGLKTSFENTFLNCYNLLEIPNGLFDECKKAFSFKSCFSGCTSLTRIPENLFANNPEAYNLESCFNGCVNLEKLPEKMFNRVISGPSGSPSIFTNCFSGCSKIKSIPKNLFANSWFVNLFRGCFQNCSSLEYIPEDLFIHNYLPNDFQSCFRGCTSLKNIPEKLFKSLTNASDLSYCFYACKTLEFIPKDLFVDNLKITNFSSCFSECSNLRYVNLPETISNISNAYFNCTSLEYIKSMALNAPTISSNCFSGSSCPIYVPDQSVNTYKTTANWTTYADRIRPMSEFNH